MTGPSTGSGRPLLQGPQTRPGDGGCKEFHKSSKEHVSGVFSEHVCTGAYMRACVCVCMGCRVARADESGSQKEE